MDHDKHWRIPYETFFILFDPVTTLKLLSPCYLNPPTVYSPLSKRMGGKDFKRFFSWFYCHTHPPIVTVFPPCYFLNSPDTYFLLVTLITVTRSYSFPIFTSFQVCSLSSALCCHLFFPSSCFFRSWSLSGLPRPFQYCSRRWRPKK
jgi:hypothetical protein